MMRSGGALAMVVATLVVCSSALPHREQDSVEHSGERFDTNDHKTRNLEPLGGGTLVRGVREVRPPAWLAYVAARKPDYSPYGGKREMWPMVPPQYGGYYAVGLPKRNFDEIDRSALDNFVRKRNFDEIDQTSMPFSKKNFDEIDQTSMPFPYGIKRYVHLYGSRLLGSADYDHQRNQLNALDDVDLTGYPLKRSSDHYSLAHAAA